MLVRFSKKLTPVQRGYKMKKPTRRNIKYKNSEGRSGKEYLLGSQAGRFQNKELSNDYDYLDKLSPDEFAWLAEFNANYTSGQLAVGDIVGEGAADKMNDQIERRKAWVREKRRREEAYIFKSRSRTIDRDEVDMKCEENLLVEQFSQDKFTEMEKEIEDNIDEYWRVKNS